MSEVKIREINSKDIPKLQELATLTFVESYANNFSEKELKPHLKKLFSEKRLQKEVKNDQYFFYLAVKGRKPVGYLKLDLDTGISRRGERKKKNQCVELSKLYIHPNMTGKRIGSKLLGKALGIARNAGYKTMALTVWAENERAVRFYQSMGFEIQARFSKDFAKGKITEILMKREL